MVGQKDKRTREQKYCSCVMKVRGNSYKKSKKVINPYGICTNSLYNLQNKKRTKMIKCTKKYNFKIYSLPYLQAYALEKKLPIKTKSGKLYNKSILVKKLEKYQQKK